VLSQLSTVSDGADACNFFFFKYICEFETKFENNLGSESGVNKGLFMEKTSGRKSRATVPLNLAIIGSHSPGYRCYEIPKTTFSNKNKEK
jgi:hypothetical protein